MQYIREHKKLSIIVMTCLIVFLFCGITFGKYIYNIINNFILETKSFYFTSSILTVNRKGYSINNWDGVNPYTLTIDLSNRKNDERRTKADISYNIEVKCSSNVTCSLSKNSGVIYEDGQNDSYQITVTPTRNFYEGDVATVETSVISNSPYTKKLSAFYNIGVAKSNFSYSIEDSVNSKYMTLNLTNSVTYYEVSEAFGSYKVGDQISIDDYSKLSDTDKDKCFSAIVSISFNPHNVFCDLTNNLYLNRIGGKNGTTKVDGYEFVDSFSFKVNASSNNSIIFYKNDIKKDYTYPIGTKSPIIKVSVTTAK